MIGVCIQAQNTIDSGRGNGFSHFCDSEGVAEAELPGGIGASLNRSRNSKLNRMDKMESRARLPQQFPASTTSLRAFTFRGRS